MARPVAEPKKARPASARQIYKSQQASVQPQPPVALQTPGDPPVKVQRAERPAVPVIARPTVPQSASTVSPTPSQDALLAPRPDDTMAEPQGRIRVSTKVLVLHSSSPRRTASLVCLDVDESVLLLGTAQMTILRGSATSACARLTRNSPTLRLHASSLQPIVPLTALPGSSSAPALSVQSELSERGYKLPESDEAIRRASTVVLFEDLNDGSRGIEQLARSAGILSSRSIWSTQPYAQKATYEFVSLDDIAQNSLSLLELSATWSSALERLHTGTSDIGLRVMIEGGKRVGKSTLMKLAVNRLLEKHASVAVLDTDMGQSEMTSPGQISLTICTLPLIGSAFTRSTRPVRSHFLGALSPRTDAAHYIACLSDLMRCYTRLGSMPLVVNTQGWTKGLGAELQSALCDLVEPSMFIRFSSAESRDHFEGPAAEMAQRDYVTIEPIADDIAARSLSAADLRTLNLMSDLQRRWQPDGMVNWNYNEPIVATPPFLVPYSAGEASVNQIFIADAEIAPAHGLRLLDASLVGLIVSDEPIEDAGELFLTGMPDPSRSHCIGLGVIRAIDGSQLLLQLVTSIPPEDLERCQTLVRGSELALPLIGMIDWRNVSHDGDLDSGGLTGPYLTVAGSTGLGGTKRRVRRNLMRASQR
ncbi:uncharacterized protein L969DRAFT_97090 [Mixia osmundae IAM 14324]|uniref:Polynucleotide 5'-hydroxyl-kinase GRC3 n=1 Tax=Mixia osmundae (strain CBS 9802 / IAM 14324 / JCM 22182 / KY 12970) TaxID=764103 RepID=G7E1N1_MIXOS|nr:uncharacterized protein L969DRAFT_97090 [Mixia osmundae IAM 14324]KEI36691.1 hypothetical protein L969DRAFT_97090 [Mixia osmundae IAM 14324]GAA96741.1 hypothetical protein E5Q_03412 [Mixia osmundae IAM 14324]